MTAEVGGNETLANLALMSESSLASLILPNLVNPALDRVYLFAFIFFLNSPGSRLSSKRTDQSFKGLIARLGPERSFGSELNEFKF